MSLQFIDSIAKPTCVAVALCSKSGLRSDTHCRWLTPKECLHMQGIPTERELSFGEKMRLKLLCFMCPFTNRYNEQIGTLHQRIGHCDEETIEVMKDASLSDEYKNRLKEKLAREDTA